MGDHGGMQEGARVCRTGAIGQLIDLLVLVFMRLLHGVGVDLLVSKGDDGCRHTCVRARSTSDGPKPTIVRPLVR